MYTEPIATMGILLVIFALCWYLEMRTCQKLRNGHREECRRLREAHASELAKERSAAWQEGVRMGAEARRQMRYGQQFHHSKQGKF